MKKVAIVAAMAVLIPAGALALSTQGRFVKDCYIRAVFDNRSNTSDSVYTWYYIDQTGAPTSIVKAVDAGAQYTTGYKGVQHGTMVTISADGELVRTETSC